jgi:ATP-dependent Zn protease
LSPLETEIPESTIPPAVTLTPVATQTFEKLEKSTDSERETETTIDDSGNPAAEEVKSEENIPLLVAVVIAFVIFCIIFAFLMYTEKSAREKILKREIAKLEAQEKAKLTAKQKKYIAT